jgi:sugar (pentulose or hexulose) kinase
MMKTVAVFDVSKTNVKLTAAHHDGKLIETIAAPNPT